MTTPHELRHRLLAAALREPNTRLLSGTEVVVIDLGSAAGRAFARSLGHHTSRVIRIGRRSLGVVVLGAGELARLVPEWWPRSVAVNAIDGGEVRVACFAEGGLALGVRLAERPRARAS